jgi:hypothetical protein
MRAEALAVALPGRVPCRRRGRVRRALAWCSLLGGLLLALGLAGGPLTGPSRPRAASGAAAPVKAGPEAREAALASIAGQGAGAVVLRRIETIRLGQRVLGQNPLGGSGAEPEPDPAMWRQVDLELVKSQGRILYAVLLRNQAWLEEHRARVGGKLWLDMPEMGARGWAKVTAVGPCPPIEPGPGQVVTGTFQHQPDDSALDVRVSGLPEPIGVTTTHPFWSEDRRAFVAASELRRGERVRTAALGAVPVMSVTHRPREGWVYNLEVHGEHVYEVSPLGVLAHNNNTEAGPQRFRQIPKHMPGGHGSLGLLGDAQATRAVNQAVGIKPGMRAIKLQDGTVIIFRNASKKPGTVGFDLWHGGWRANEAELREIGRTPLPTFHP